MKEQGENIDQLFKDKLSGRSFDIPAGYVSNLEGMLPPEKSNGKLFWWLGGSLILIGVLVAGYFWNNGSSIKEYYTLENVGLVDSVSVDSFISQQDFDKVYASINESSKSNGAEFVNNTDGHKLPDNNSKINDAQSSSGQNTSSNTKKDSGDLTNKTIVKNTSSKNTKETIMILLINLNFTKLSIISLQGFVRCFFTVLEHALSKKMQ